MQLLLLYQKALIILYFSQSYSIILILQQLKDCQQNYMKLLNLHLHFIIHSKIWHLWNLSYHQKNESALLHRDFGTIVQMCTLILILKSKFCYSFFLVFFFLVFFNFFLFYFIILLFVFFSSAFKLFFYKFILFFFKITYLLKI